MSTKFSDFKNVMDAMKKTLENIEKEVCTIEVEEVKRLLKKYDVVLKDDIEEKDLVLKYETFYDQLGEYILKKRERVEEVEEVEETLENYSGFVNDEKVMTIINKKKSNVNEIVDCINRVVRRIKELEVIIYNKRLRELEGMKVFRYDDIEQKQKSKQSEDDGMNIINNSMNYLKEWSNKHHHQVIFDSNEDGDGTSLHALHKIVSGRSYLYFITFDNEGNVFGGYVNDNIIVDSPMDDKNCFVFSLLRNYKTKNMKYHLESGHVCSAFRINKGGDLLYYFGYCPAISMFRVGVSKSCVSQDTTNFLFNKEVNALGESDKDFSAKRIVVLQMK
ncbi:TLDc domain-containing protein [Entamoeba marina]